LLVLCTLRIDADTGVKMWTPSLQLSYYILRTVKLHTRKRNTYSENLGRVCVPEDYYERRAGKVMWLVRGGGAPSVRARRA
jgi:hypothetical protein